jgi:hypothetical protein
MSDIKTKRASLEGYLREQVIGPGAGRNRVVRTNKDEDFLFLTQSYSDNREEALRVVPGIYYSSGILFPNKGNRLEEADINTAKILDEADANLNIETDVETDENNTLEERNLSEEHDVVQMDQMYPKTMGFTFCMKAEDLKRNGFEFIISGRHYKRVKDDDVKNFGVRAEVSEAEFKEILDIKLGDNSSLGSYFKLEKIGEFCFIKQFSPYPVVDLFDDNGAAILNAKGKQKQRIENILNLASREIGNQYFQANLNLFPDGYANNGIVTIDSLFKYIANQLLNVCVDINVRQVLYEASQKLEKYQNIVDHLRDANEIFTGSYGVWEALSIVKRIKVKSIDLGNSIKKIYRENKLHDAKFLDENEDEIHNLNDVIMINLNESEKAALTINLQLSKDTRLNNELIYCKILVINSSSAFIENGDKYYSMASEGVNERSFFGVECKVESAKLQGYNERSADTAVDELALGPTIRRGQNTAFTNHIRRHEELGQDGVLVVFWPRGRTHTCYMAGADSTAMIDKARQVSTFRGIYNCVIVHSKQIAASDTHPFVHLFSDIRHLLSN